MVRYTTLYTPIIYLQLYPSNIIKTTIYLYTYAAALSERNIKKNISTTSVKKPTAKAIEKPIVVPLPRAPSIPIPPLPFEGSAHADSGSDSDSRDYDLAETFLPSSGPAKLHHWKTMPRSLPSQRPARLLQEASHFTPPPLPGRSNSTTPLSPGVSLSEFPILCN